MSAEASVHRIADIRDDPREIDRLFDRLQPGENRRAILQRFDELFRSGMAPDPAPDGFLPGRLLATSTWPALDDFGVRLARMWMPWQGKSFMPASSMGVNRFAPSARGPLRIVFPTYRPEAVRRDRIECFSFRTRIGPGELDPGVSVLKIDYDFEANPSFIIRHILDELVQLAPGVYLGKVLFRIGRRFHAIGFFSLRSAASAR